MTDRVDAEPGIGREIARAPRQSRALYGTTLFIGIGVAAGRLATLILVSVISHSVGQGGVALYGLATLVGSIASLTVSAGLPTYLTHRFASGRLGLAEVGALHRGRAGALLLVCSGSVIVGSFAFPVSTALPFALFLTATCFDQLNDTAWLTVRGTPRAWQESLVASTFSLILVAVVIVRALTSRPTLMELAATIAAVSVVRAMAAYRVAAFPRTVKLKKLELRKTLAEAWPFLGSDILGLAYLRGDVLILAFFVAQTELGHYVSANSLVAPIVQLASTTSLGALAYMARHNRAAAGRGSAPVASLYYGLASAIAGALVPVVILAVPVLYTPGAAPSVDKLAIILTAFLLLRIWNFSLSVQVVDDDGARARFYVLLGSVILNICLNLGFDAIGGVQAAALATVATEMYITLAFSYMLRRRKGIGERSLILCIMATAVTVLVTAGRWQGLPWVFAVIYLSGLLYFAPAVVRRLKTREGS